MDEKNNRKNIYIMDKIARKYSCRRAILSYKILFLLFFILLDIFAMFRSYKVHTFFGNIGFIKIDLEISKFINYDHY